MRKMTQSFLNDNLVVTKHFVGGNYEEEKSTDGTIRKLHYISGGDGVCAIYVQNGTSDTMYYIQKDHLGSYYCVTDEDGDIVLLNDREEQIYSFDPWVRRRNPQTWDYAGIQTEFLFDRGFTGHEHLEEFNLINMNGRIYDQWLGRFLSPDPFVQAPGYSQNYNRYSYAFNNPLKYVDPSGYYAFEKEGVDLSGTSGKYDYQAGFFPGAASMGNQYRRWFISNTAHYLNAGRGVSYGTIRYHYGLNKYINTWTGKSVSYNQVHNNIILPNSTIVTGYAAQSLYNNMVGGMSIYVVNAFWRSTLVSAFGRLGSMDIASNGGISFTNPTAAAYAGEAIVNGQNNYSIMANGRELNPDGYVLRNSQLRDNVKRLYSGLVNTLGSNNFQYKVTGGDRFIKDGKIYSSTNNSFIKTLKPGRSGGAHVRGDAVDLRIKYNNGYYIPLEIVQPVVLSTDLIFDPNAMPWHYPNDFHYHLQIPKK